MFDAIYVQNYKISMKKKIFRKVILDVNNFFLIVLLSVSLIVWVIQAVNFLDFVSEDGHGFRVYFYYTLLNFPKIISAILPFVFFLSLFYILVKYENNNELLIFWTNGITKEEFTKVIIRYSLVYLIIQILLTSLVVPKTQNIARSFIRASNIDFFPSLIKEKKFIDTVENLTIFVGGKKANGEMLNIFLKDKISDTKSQIIYSKSGKIFSKDNLNFLILNDGNIINIEDKKIITLGFKQTQFNLSKYTTKTTTWPKIQEHETMTLVSCMVNTIKGKKILKENFYLRCNPDFYKEVIQEFLKRIYLPTFIPVFSMIACFVILRSKESFKYSKFKLSLFSLGIAAIIISQVSIKYTTTYKLSFLFFFIIPIIAYYVMFNIFKTKAKKL